VPKVLWCLPGRGGNSALCRAPSLEPSRAPSRPPRVGAGYRTEDLRMACMPCLTSRPLRHGARGASATRQLTRAWQHDQQAENRAQKSSHTFACSSAVYTDMSLRTGARASMRNPPGDELRISLHQRPSAKGPRMASMTGQSSEQAMFLLVMTDVHCKPRPAKAGGARRTGRPAAKCRLWACCHQERECPTLQLLAWRRIVLR